LNWQIKHDNLHDSFNNSDNNPDWNCALVAIFGILNVVFCIVAAVKASDGKAWKYPYSSNFPQRIKEQKTAAQVII